jgi:hypothetical protein
MELAPGRHGAARVTDRLTTADKALVAVYVVLGLGALVGTQVVLIDYLRSDDTSLDDLWANGVSTFVAIDLFVVAAVAVIFIVAEGRRLQMRFLWIYVVVSLTIAISVALPAFLVVRQLLLADRRDAQPLP